MSEILKEFRHAGRRLVRSPGFTIAAALTLALGVAANATIFTVVNRVILQPLPYPESESMIWVDHVAPGIELPGEIGLSQGLFDYYRKQARTLSDITIFRQDEWTLTGHGEAQRFVGIQSTPSFQAALRVSPIMGRWFTEEEAQDRTRVVVLSHSLWSTRFGSDPNIIGQLIQLDGVSREVIGVMPRGFAYPDANVQLYFPYRLDDRQLQNIAGFNYRSIARLNGGATVAEAKREMDALISRMGEAFPNSPVSPEILHKAGFAGNPSPLKDHAVGAVRQTMWILLGMVGFVLLIACANVANLFLVRSETRQREVAVRRALGAGHSGIVRYFLAESILLSLTGAAIGLLLAHIAVQLLVQFGPANLPRINEIAVDMQTVLWTGVLALLASVVFGAIPLFRRGSALAGSLRDGGRNATAGKARFRVRNGLMAVQVALALVLLVGSGLMVRSFMQLRAVDPGFVPGQLLTFNVALDNNGFPTRQSAVAFHEALVARIRSLPGVTSASGVTCLPFAGSCWGDPMLVRGRSLAPGELPPLVQIRRALPDYFETLRVPVLQGRVLEPADNQQRTGALVLSKRAAELYFPNEDPIGKQLRMLTDVEHWYTVVGVVGNTPVQSLDEDPFGVMYFPVIDPVDNIGSGVHNFAYTVRTTVPPMSLSRAIQAAAADVNPNVALGHIRSMEMIVDEATSRMAFTMVLLLIAGGIALLLGAVGIYGVISYVVGQRTSEIGVRMALGARPADVAGMVLMQSGAVVGIGLLVGLAGALTLSRLMSSLLFQVTATDALTYFMVTTFLLGIAAVAAWLPARRAAALDPQLALRAE